MSDARKVVHCAISDAADDRQIWFEHGNDESALDIIAEYVLDALRMEGLLK